MADWHLNETTFRELPAHPKVQADLDRRAEAAEAAARAVCPVGKTRKLIDSIRTEQIGAGREVLYGNNTDVWYAWLIEVGTPPHVITPSTKKALWWPGARHPVRRVAHPGTRAYRVMSGAALDAARRNPA